MIKLVQPVTYPSLKETPPGFYLDKDHDLWLVRNNGESGYTAYYDDDGHPNFPDSDHWCDEEVRFKPSSYRTDMGKGYGPFRQMLPPHPDYGKKWL